MLRIREKNSHYLQSDVLFEGFNGIKSVSMLDDWVINERCVTYIHLRKKSSRQINMLQINL